MNRNKIINHPSKLRVQHSPIHGYGVFAAADILAGTVVEECVVPTETIQAVWEYLGEKTFDMAAHTMARYRFAGPTDKHGNVVFHICPTGFAMIYNHSDDPNVKWGHDTNNRLLVFTAIKDIKRGEELCHNYGYRPSESETSEITV